MVLILFFFSLAVTPCTQGLEGTLLVSFMAFQFCLSLACLIPVCLDQKIATSMVSLNS
jgi:hypothetical protein